MQQGRVATADALLIFFMTLTGLAGGKLLGIVLKLDAEHEAARCNCRWTFWGWMLALGVAGGFLAKGPEALLPVVAIFFGARRSGPRVLVALAAIVLLGLFVVAWWWAVPAFVLTHGDYWKEGLGHDVGDRMITGFQGHGASTAGWYLLGIPLYLLTFWLSALPWSPLLATHGRKLFAGWKPDAIDTYLLLNAGLIFRRFFR